MEGEGWRGGSTSLGPDGVSSELKERFHGGRARGCQWGAFAGGSLSSKSWYVICAHRRWSDLLRSRRCLQTPEKEMLQYIPQLIKTVEKEIMKVESSRQVHSVVCCSMMVDTARVELNTWWHQHYRQNIRPPSKVLTVESRRTALLGLASEEERETTKTRVPRVRVEIGSDPRGLNDSLRG